jgi:hypothetical protein
MAKKKKMEFQQKHNNLNSMKKIIGSIIFF